MADMLNRTFSYGGGFDSAVVDIAYAGEGGGGSVLDAVVLLSFACSYGQQVSRLMSLGEKGKLFTVTGYPEGSAQFSHATAPGDKMRAFISKFGDACKVATNSLRVTSSAGCVADDDTASAKTLSLALGMVIVQSFGLSADAQNPVSTMNGAMQFSKLSITGGTA